MNYSRRAHSAELNLTLVSTEGNGWISHEIFADGKSLGSVCGWSEMPEVCTGLSDEQFDWVKAQIFKACIAPQESA